MMSPAPTLFVLAGPNGAGKSSLYSAVFGPRLDLPFVNADIIQRDQLGDRDMAASYRASDMAAEQRDGLLSARKSFVMETVFSHPSKVALIERASSAGYRISVHHIGVDTPELSVARVDLRVRRGGHPVPEDKIRARYARNGALIRKAVELADRGTVWDNSVHATPPRQVLRYREGTRTFASDPLPAWVAAIYSD